MADNIKDLEQKLAEARANQAKEVGFTVVVFDENLENLKEIKVKAHDLTEKEKADIMQAASRLGDNMEEITGLAEQLDRSVGPWLKLMTLIDDPLKEIIGGMFKLDTKIVATLPNLDLLSLIFEGNPWIDSKAHNLAKELDYISNKNK